MRRFIPGMFVLAGLYAVTCAGLIMLFQGPAGYTTAMAVVVVGVLLIGAGYISHTVDNEGGGPGVLP